MFWNVGWQPANCKKQPADPSIGLISPFDSPTDSPLQLEGLLLNLLGCHLTSDKA